MTTPTVRRYTPDEINNGIYPKAFSLFVLASDYAALEARCGALHKAADAMWCAVDSFQQVMDVQVIQDHGYQGEWNAMSDALHEYRAALTREAK